MVARVARDHELALPMDPLGHPDPVLDQKAWVYEGGLVSDELRTFFSLFRKLLLKKFFELIVAV